MGRACCVDGMFCWVVIPLSCMPVSPSHRGSVKCLCSADCPLRRYAPMHQHSIQSARRIDRDLV